MTATQPFAMTFDEAWEHFTTQTTTDDESAHAIHQRMRQEKSSYISFLIPVTSTQIVEATRPAREALTTAGIADVLPSHYFHISVLGICLASELPAGSIARIMDRTSRAMRDVPPVRLTLRGVNSFSSAAFVEVHDETNGLRALRDALVRCLNRIGLPGFGASALSGRDEPPKGEAARDHADPMNAPPYLPHMSICYYREHYPTAKAAGILEPFRAMELGALRLDHVTLAAMPHSDYDRFPEITRVADLLLG